MTANISSLSRRHNTQGTAPIEGESQELVDVLSKIVQNAGALLEVNNCSVALLDIAGTTLVKLAALQKHGHQPRHTRFRLNEGVAGWVAEHGEPLIINDVSRDTRFKRLGRISVGSMVCVPLIDGETFIGTLTVSSAERDSFNPRKVQMLTIFAEQAVLAITNARHAELAQRQAEQLEMLLDLSRGITTRLDADGLYRTILADIRRLVPCDVALIYQHNERTQELVPVAELSGMLFSPMHPACEQDVCTSAVLTEDIQRERISLHNSTSGIAWAAIHRHPMLHTSAHMPQAEQEATLLISSALEHEAVAEMATPLVSKNVLYGVIALQRGEAFTSEELRLVRNLSNMAAAALENVELFHRVRTDQEQLRAILSSSSDGIALIGINGCFIEANPAFERLFGVDQEHLMGMECLELLGCEEERSHGLCRELCMVQQALQLEQLLPYTEIDVIVKGSSRSVGLSLTPVATPTRPLCLMVARDVTAIRDASRIKANFISMVTHELRAPLNAIHGYLDLTLTGVAGELNGQQREFVQRARAGSEHLYALLEDLLLVSRADAGQLRMNREVISLQEIIANAVEELELMALDSSVQVNVEIAANFPPLYADMVRLQQVLRNLLNNALRFTPSSGQVTIAAAIIGKSWELDANAARLADLDGDGSDERLVQIQVRDTGCGIALEHQERIFDRFYQAPQTMANRVGGQGLGLAIVKMIVELHGGKVFVESVLGQGSTFTCVLPCLLSAN